jgi:predicted RNA polymerase sigma factor
MKAKRWSSVRSPRVGLGRTRCKLQSRRCMLRRMTQQQPIGCRWQRYKCLAAGNPSPAIALNRSVAVSMRDSPAAGLVLIEGLLEHGALSDYYLAHAAHADLCAKLGNMTQAIAYCRKALSLARQEPSRRFLNKRLCMLLDRATAEWEQLSRYAREFID